MWFFTSIRKTETKDTQNNAIQVAKYIVYLRNFDRKRSHYYSLSNLKMQKILYYCQGYYYQLYDKPLFEDDIEAWSYGPTVPTVYAHFSTHGQNDIREEEGKEFCLSQQEMEVIKTVWEQLAKYDAFKLVNATHAETPWKEAYEKGERNISKESIREFFRSVL